MAVTVVASPGAVAGYITAAMALVFGVMLALFSGGRRSRSGDEMYIGGESEALLKVRVPSNVAMYWGIVRRAMGRVYTVLRDVVHSGKLSTWSGFMVSWFTILMFIAIGITVVIASVYGW